MRIDKSVWVDADPGGKGKGKGRGDFGIAVLTGGAQVVTSRVTCTDEAVSFVQANIRRKPDGVGVDAPLWWSSGVSGDRHADQWLRNRYGFPGGQVQAANSLRGAALTQGAMFVQRIREVFREVPVTESHPKALFKAVAKDNWDVFSARYRLNIAEPASEHERDAIIAAVAAREGFLGRWTHDLASTRLPSEQDPMAYWLSPVHYYWPET